MRNRLSVGRGRDMRRSGTRVRSRRSVRGEMRRHRCRRRVSRMLSRGIRCRMLGSRRVVRFVRGHVNHRRGFRVPGAVVFARSLVTGMFLMLGSAFVGGRAMVEHVLVMISRRGLFRGDLVFVVIRVETMLRGEMLRVPVVRGPKTFCETIFHAKSLSEIRLRCVADARKSVDRRLKRICAGCAAGRIGSFRTIGKLWRVLHKCSRKKRAEHRTSPLNCLNYRFSMRSAARGGTKDPGWAFVGSRFGNGSPASSCHQAAIQSFQSVRVRPKTSASASTVG